MTEDFTQGTQEPNFAAKKLILNVIQVMAGIFFVVGLVFIFVNPTGDKYLDQIIGAVFILLSVMELFVGTVILPKTWENKRN